MRNRRNNAQLEAELNEIYGLLVAGASNREIMNLRNIKERNFRKYLDKLHDKIMKQAIARREDYFLDDVEITKTRLKQDKRALWAIIESDSSNYAQKLEAIKLDGELNITLMRLEYEGSLYLHGNGNHVTRYQPEQEQEQVNSTPIQLSQPTSD